MPRADHGLDPASDEALAARCAEGDEDAFAALMGRHRDLVYAVCLRVTGHREDALDALQETLVRVWRHAGGFRDDARFTTWLYRIAVNAALDEVKRRSRHAGNGQEPAAPQQAPPPDEQVVRRLEVTEALARLAPPYRAAIVLRDCCDLPYEEIAEVLGIPLNTVKSRISRARQALLDLLDPAAERRAPA